MKDWKKDFELFMVSQINEKSNKQIESHFAFIRQLLTVSIAAIGFMSVIIRAEDVTDTDIKLIRFIIASLSLCILSCVVLLFGQKRMYGDQVKALREYKRKVLDEEDQSETNIDVPIERLFVFFEKASYAFFFLAVFGLVWYSLGIGL